MTPGEIIVAIVVAVLGSGGLAVFVDRKTRQRQGEAAAARDIAEAGGKTLDGAFSLIEGLQGEIERLREITKGLESTVASSNRKMARMERAVSAFTKRIDYLMGGIATLIGQITEAKQSPCWQPDEWDPPDVEE